MKRLAITAVALAVMLSSTAFAQNGQDIAPRVVVPDHPAGIAVNGCFRANQLLFGPHRLTFCLERAGSYRVTGGGLNCNGRLFWNTAGRDIFIDLERTSCGSGRAWEAASMRCNHMGGLLRRLGNRLLDTPMLASLQCTYFPNVSGVGTRTFTASRM